MSRCPARLRADRDAMPGQGSGAPIPVGRRAASRHRGDGDAGRGPSRRRAARPVPCAALGRGLAALALAVAVVSTRVRRDRWLHQRHSRRSRASWRPSSRTARRSRAPDREVAPGDSTLNRLLAKLHEQGRDSLGAPRCAGVSRPLADTTRWHLLGATPTDSLGLPNTAALFRFEKPGFRTTYSVLSPSPWKWRLAMRRPCG